MIHIGIFTCQKNPWSGLNLVDSHLFSILIPTCERINTVNPVFHCLKDPVWVKLRIFRFQIVMTGLNL